MPRRFGPRTRVDRPNGQPEMGLATSVVVPSGSLRRRGRRLGVVATLDQVDDTNGGRALPSIARSATRVRLLLARHPDGEECARSTGRPRRSRSPGRSRASRAWPSPRAAPCSSRARSGSTRRSGTPRPLGTGRSTGRTTPRPLGTGRSTGRTTPRPLGTRPVRGVRPLVHPVPGPVQAVRPLVHSVPGPVQAVRPPVHSVPGPVPEGRPIVHSRTGRRAAPSTRPRGARAIPTTPPAPPPRPRHSPCRMQSGIPNPSYPPPATSSPGAEAARRAFTSRIAARWPTAHLPRSPGRSGRHLLSTRLGVEAHEGTRSSRRARATRASSSPPSTASPEAPPKNARSKTWPSGARPSHLLETHVLARDRVPGAARHDEAHAVERVGHVRAAVAEKHRGRRPEGHSAEAAGGGVVDGLEQARRDVRGGREDHAVGEEGLPGREPRLVASALPSQRLDAGAGADVDAARLDRLAERRDQAPDARREARERARLGAASALAPRGGARLRGRAHPERERPELPLHGHELREGGADRQLVGVARRDPAEQRRDEAMGGLAAEAASCEGPDGLVVVGAALAHGHERLHRHARLASPRRRAACGRSGPRRVGTPSTRPSGTGWSASFHATKYRRVSGRVPTRASPRPSARASAVACGLLETQESGPASRTKSPTRSVCTLPPRRPERSTRVTEGGRAPPRERGRRRPAPRRGP